MKQRLVIERILLPNALAVGEDLGAVGIFFGWHMTGFFEQWHVDKRGCIALGARVSIPIPSATKVAPFLNDPNIRDPLLLEPCSGDQAGKSAADKGEGHMIGNARSFGYRGMWIG